MGDAVPGTRGEQPAAGALAAQNIESHDVSRAVVDFDGDGTPDFLGGAEDGRFYLPPQSALAAQGPPALAPNQ